MKLLWEVSIMELRDKSMKKYKVTRRLPELKIAETLVFCSKAEAERQFSEWLQENSSLF